MFTISASVSPRNVSRKLAELASPGMELALRGWGSEIEPMLLQALRAAAPVRTGAFQKSIRSQRLSYGRTIRIEFHGESPKTAFIIHGTRPHEILPHGKVLVFDGKGGVVFTTRVSHPGTKPNKFAQKVLKQYRPIMLRMLTAQVRMRMPH